MALLLPLGGTFLSSYFSPPKVGASRFGFWLQLIHVLTHVGERLAKCTVAPDPAGGYNRCYLRLNAHLNFPQQTPTNLTPWRSAAKLRRIAANIAKLPELLKKE